MLDTRYSFRPRRNEKQSDFGCFNGLRMLLWDRSLDVCVSGLVLISICEEVEL